MMTLRDYQSDAVASVWKHLREKDTNPCVVIPTAGGKSLCIAQVAKDAVTNWGGRVLCLAHVKELIEQNAAKIRAICPELKDFSDEIGLDDVIAQGIMPYGLAAHLLLGENDSMASFFNERYSELVATLAAKKPSVWEEITPYYGF